MKNTVFGSRARAPRVDGTKAQLTERPFSAPPPPARSAPLDRPVLMSPRYSGDNRRVKDGYRPTRSVGPGDGPAQETREQGSAKAACGVSSDADRPAWLVFSAGASGGARPSQVPPSHSGQDRANRVGVFNRGDLVRGESSASLGQLAAQDHCSVTAPSPSFRR
jgi:hypothetical protein